MKNSPYLDQSFVPLVVELWSMLAETEAKIAAAAQPTRHGSKSGPKCCGSGLGRKQRARPQLSP
jgi:hypothetical protein